MQTPAQTLANNSGTCRDFAVLMIEAVRALGLAARFVSGYLYVPERGGRVGRGATHAWLRVYLPGAGWVELDATKRHHRQPRPHPRGRRARPPPRPSPARHLDRISL